MSLFCEDKNLKDCDPILFDLIEQEKRRQWSGLELIASENFTSKAVMDCLGSCLTNKYAEGIPYKRYYGGNEIIDQIENLCKDRALDAFHVNKDEWGVNVQPYSGSPANFAVYTALLKPHDRIMGLDLPSGGHLTHGFYTYNKKEGTRRAVSATSIFFESLPYHVNPETGYIDYENLAEMARIFKPAMIICGGSAYPREWDYAKFREICDENGSLLMCDMAHISGLVATNEASSPFEYCDIVTTTTHKSLRGPRAGMIFYKKQYENQINSAVFPSLQGGPHEHQIAAIATQLREVMTPEFHQYTRQILSNCEALANALMNYGYTLATNGTDNHLILWNLRPQNITGSKFEKLCDVLHITLNKNSIPGDRSAVSPGGVRIGTPALTTRGFREEHFEKVAEFLHRAVQIALNIQSNMKTKKLTEFVELINENDDINNLKNEIKEFSSQFPMPGFSVEDMKYK